jgi:mutator protein MutT
MEKPFFFVAIALVYRNGRWLVAKRTQSAHLGGLWEFPGGKIETGETPAQAAIRELWEECRVVAQPANVLPARLHEYADRRVEIYPVSCRWQSGEAQAAGNLECRWVTPAELSRLPIPPANAAIIADMEQLLAAQ